MGFGRMGPTRHVATIYTNAPCCQEHSLAKGDRPRYEDSDRPVPATDGSRTDALQLCANSGVDGGWRDTMSLARSVRVPLQDNQIQSVSAWGHVVAG